MSRVQEALKPKAELTGNRMYWLKPGLGAMVREVRVFKNDSSEPVVVWAQGWRGKTALRRAQQGKTIDIKGS